MPPHEMPGTPSLQKVKLPWLPHFYTKHQMTSPSYPLVSILSSESPPLGILPFSPPLKHLTP